MEPESSTRASAPLLIVFAPGTSIYRETDLASDLRILRNGPPGTFVIFPEGTRVSLPTDQILWMGVEGGAARVAFGGMMFTGLERGRLTFDRIRDLRPEEELSPDRSWKMTLDPGWVSSVAMDGRRVWPAD